MKFYEKNFAHEYDKRLSAEGYPGILFDSILEHLQSNETILDIGAGSGFFTVPLAKKQYTVIAIEPSPEMGLLLKRKLDKQSSSKISIFQEKWEDYAGEKAQTSISIHSLYAMKDIEKSLLKMKKYAKKSLLIIRSDEKVPTLTNIIREHYKIYQATHFEKKVYDTLTSNNIRFTSQTILQDRMAQFTDITQEAEYYRNHLNLQESDIQNISKIIEKNVHYKDNRYQFISHHKDKLIVF